MASDLGDGDYLGAYRRFFVDFLDKINPDDQLPIKTSGHDVTEAEIVGETVHMTLQYLNQELCPPSLQCYIVQQVIEEIKATCRKEPEACGFRQEENTYAPLKLMQAIAGKVNEICQRYLENSRLALLPPPPSTPMPLATAFAIRNNRRKMEDRHVVLHDLNTIFNIKDDSVASYYAVFDGHAGYQAAVYCAAHLHQYLAESRHYPTDPERALRDAFLKTDELFIQKSTRQTLSSGTTAVCALILKKKLYVAWVGDSQAALAKRRVVSQLVNPHKPDRNDERERVEAMGGTVMHHGTWRVNGNLAVSRAIGDAQYKPYVTGNPEISCISLDGYEDFLIIACDGLWDYVTERQAAGVVYSEVLRDPYDYDSVSQRLVQYAKNQGSIDNITVIVVFLTAPVKIASRPHEFDNPLIADVQLNNMDPDNRFVSNSNGQFDVNSPFAKQPSAKDVSPDLMPDEDPYEAYDNKSSNGKHHENGGLPVREYDAEEDDDDLGPETDVDALDDVADSGPTLADVSRQLFPEKQDPCELYQADEGVDDDSPPSPNAKKTNQQALIPEADNVGDSEDSEDEWNYYRIEPNKEKDQAGAAADTVPVAKGDSEIVDSVVVSSSPSDHGDVLEIEKEQESANNDTDSCSSESDSEREVRSSALIDAEISPDSELRENPPSAVPIETEETNDRTDQLEENRAQEEDMDFQLNPNAAEFVPVSPTPILPTRSELDAPIAGSPLKQTPLMDDMKVPSRREFQNEVRHRPGEIEEKSCANGELLDDLDDEQTSTTKKNETAAPSSKILDESEVSSTKAEFGDESSFLTTSEFHRTGVSNFDGSFTDSNVGFDDSTMDLMTKSFGPGDFVALSNSVDLNAVHDLTDADLMAEESSPQDELDQQRNNLLNIEKSDEPAEIDRLSSSTVGSLPDNQNANVLDSSSPVSSLHAHDIQQDACDFGSEIDKPAHNADGSISDMLGVERPEEKHTIDTNLEEREIERADAPGLVDESNVTSKLLEMDLEDRGSQDCGFEKCHETWRADEPKFEQTEDIIVESSAKIEEPTDFISSPVTEENLIECSAPSDEPSDFVSHTVTNENLIECPAPSEATADLMSSPVTEENLMDSCSMPDSLPIVSTNLEESSRAAENREEPEIDEMVKSFGDFRAHDESEQINVAPDVPVLQNPLDLNVDSRTSLDNLALEDPQMVDYVVAKAPESPGVGVSPLDPQRSDNPFAVVDNSALPTSQTESRSIDDFETTEQIPIEDKHEVNETPLETEEAVNVSTGLKLSESLQEFTGLEQQLNPEKVTNGLAPEENLMEIHNEESNDTDIVQEQPVAQIDDEIKKIVDEEPPSKEPLLPAEEKTAEPASHVEEAAVVAAVATAAVAAAATAKPTKSKPTTKTAQKPASTKPSANKSTPTSPTKAAVPSARSSAGPKKPSTAAARPNKLETGAKAGPAAPAIKPTTATKSTLSAPKTSARLSSSASSPRAKLPSTATTKPTTTLVDKKPITNGDASKSSTAPKVGPATSRAPSKPLVKPAPSARPLSAAPKPKPASTTTTKVSRASTTTGTVGTTTQRPKTAPASSSATSLASKSRLAAGKPPITEKQIKETANKQISSSRTSTTTTATKTSRTSTASSTTTSKRLVASKTSSSTAAPAVPPPIKKPAPISRLGAKTAAANAKSNATKTTTTTTSKTKVVVQNGVCTAGRETNVVTSTTITRNSDETNDEDVPKKDASPVDLPTDNQLIITAD